DGFERSLHVGFDDDRQLLALAGGDLGEHLLERAARRDLGLGFALFLMPELRDLTRPVFIFDNDELFAGKRRALQAQYLTGRRRSRLAQTLTALPDEPPDAHPFHA